MKTKILAFVAAFGMSTTVAAQGYYSSPYGGAGYSSYGYNQGAYGQQQGYGQGQQGYYQGGNRYGGYGQQQQAPTPDAGTEAAALLREGIYKLVGFIEQTRSGQAGNIPPELAKMFLDREISPYFDFAYMARWAAGKHYRRLTSSQRVLLQDKVKTMFYGTLAGHLGTYDNQEMRFFPGRMGKDGKEVTVPVWLLQPGGYPIKLEFRFYRSSHGWKVFDVVANSTSAVMYYRQHVNRKMREQGVRWLLD